MQFQNNFVFLWSRTRILTRAFDCSWGTSCAKVLWTEDSASQRSFLLPLQNTGLIGLSWKCSVVPMRHCDLRLNPIFCWQEASVLSLYAACTPVASCTGQAWCALQNGYKQFSGSNSEICGKLWFSEMNIVSGDWLLVFQATAILYFKRFYQKWSVMEHDPKHIMWVLQRPINAIGCKYKSGNYCAIILLACKVAIHMPIYRALPLYCTPQFEQYQ
jgi:hypothetical protein